MSFELSSLFSASAIRNNGCFNHFDVVETRVPGAIVFCETRRHFGVAASNPNVSAIVTTASAFSDLDMRRDVGLVICTHARFDYWTAFNSLVVRDELKPSMEFGRGQECQIHPSAVVSEKVLIGDRVEVQAGAVIGDYSIIGPDSVIGMGAKIGASGLESANGDGQRLIVRHAGGVRLGARVAVLANAIVSRAVHPSWTIIGDDTHISLLSSIGHQSTIGKNCSLAGNCLVGGGVRMGDGVIVGPSVSIKDGVSIGSGARIRIGSVVVQDVPAGKDVSGNFAMPHTANIRNYARIKNG